MDAIKNWFRSRQAESDKRNFDRGFDWAAGALLRGDTTPAHIESLTYYSTHQFDRGADAAVDLLVSRYGLSDNRIY